MPEIENDCVPHTEGPDYILLIRDDPDHSRLVKIFSRNHSPSVIIVDHYPHRFLVSVVMYSFLKIL